MMTCGSSTFAMNDGNHGKGSSYQKTLCSSCIIERLRELIEQIEDWPEGVQKEAVASSEATAGYVSLYEPSRDDR